MIVRPNLLGNGSRPQPREYLEPHQRCNQIGCAAYARTPMTARPQNNILKSLLRQEIDSGQAASLHSQSKVVATLPRKRRLVIVATDGSTSIINSKSADVPKPQRRTGRLPATPPKNRAAIISPRRCPGARRRLSCLKVEDETASKLIAGMHAMTANETAAHMQAEIGMPSAKTDLQEIFKTDKVCIVGTHKAIP